MTAALRNIIAALLFVMLAVTAAYLYGKHDGGAAERLKVVKARVDTLTIRSHTADTIYRREKAKLGPVVTRWDSVRVTDTVVVATPVPSKPESVTVFVPRAPADSAIRLCLRVVESCEARHTADTTLVAALRKQIDAEKALRPGFFRRSASKLLWGVGGGLLGYAVGRR